MSTHPGVLPSAFCWTRFGDEAGETVTSIIRRKELERQENGGIFLWGVGNNIEGPMRQLLHNISEPVLVFSPKKHPARARDRSPREVVMWRSGLGLTGQPVTLPARSRVTSGWDGSGKPKAHFALVCATDNELAIRPEPRTSIYFSQLRNLQTRNRLADQQMTQAVYVEQTAPATRDPFPVTMRVNLVEPYFVQLAEPVLVPPELRSA